MHRDIARQIASHYLPSRWHYHYSQAKLTTDPLFAGVCAALVGNATPLLDVGCGIGLLAHCLRNSGLHMAYLGVDNDAGKIRRAQAAARHATLTDVRFATVDLRHDFPAHQGSVVVLDVLQYLPEAAQQALLERICACITPDALLVIRTGMEDRSWRTQVTRAADMAGRLIRWMNTAPRRYPTREQLTECFSRHGLHSEFTPLWGNTPFNNWLVVARRQSGNTAR
jgi:2-polyprenyl-3-methyl-5-hydroxy-6-metoxy-1,4-benzoquinol methylase